MRPQTELAEVKIAGQIRVEACSSRDIESEGRSGVERDRPVSPETVSVESGDSRGCLLLEGMQDVLEHYFYAHLVVVSLPEIFDVVLEFHIQEAPGSL